MKVVWQLVFGAVGEDVRAAAVDDPGLYQVGQVAVPGDPAKADDGADLGQGCDLSSEVRRTIADLLRGGLVCGRGAADDGRDPGVAEAKSVVAGEGAGLGGEAERVEDGKHEVAGAVSGEGAAGAVGAVGSGRKAENEDAGAGVAEAGNGPRPVGLVQVSAAAGLADGLTVEAETRATLALDDVFAGAIQGFWSVFSDDLRRRGDVRGRNSV